MPSWDEISRIKFLSNSVGEWALALLVFLVALTVLPLLKRLVSARRRRWAQAPREVPAAIEVAALLVDRTGTLFLLVVALACASTQIQLPRNIERIVNVAIVLTFWFQFGLWAMAVVRFAISRRARRAGGPDAVLASSIDIIVFIAGITIWGMAFLLALDNLGVQIKPLLAGLGITGIAVALAVQAVLGDLLASLSIALDKPFVVGDSLQVDDINGTVEHIGVKSTRLRSISGEQVIITNADILKSRLHNNGRMRERRAVFTLNITYDTPAEKLRAIAPVVREIIQAQAHTRFDRCHFLTYGEWALRFETVYFVTVPDYGVYADAQQAINLAIFERFAAMGVEFAFPSRPVDPLAHPAPTS
jgi:small-conductance mechanosensitive channel